jgi:hypothetical protein
MAVKSIIGERYILVKASSELHGLLTNPADSIQYE